MTIDFTRRRLFILSRLHFERLDSQRSSRATLMQHSIAATFQTFISRPFLLNGQKPNYVFTLILVCCFPLAIIFIVLIKSLLIESKILPDRQPN